MLKCFCFTLFFLSSFVCGGLFAAKKVYSIGSPVGIVAAYPEWLCVMGNTHSPIKKHPSGHYPDKYLTGKNLVYPCLEFEFFCYNQRLNEQFFNNYAINASTVFSNVKKINDDKNHLLITGSYFDNNSTGCFAYYFLKTDQKIHDGGGYLMFVKIDADLLGDNSSDEMFQSAFDLITPLYQP